MKQDIKTTIAVSAMSLVTSLAMTTGTFATPICGTHDLIASTLSTEYNEIPVHRGLTPKGTMVEVFSSESGTFTVVVTIPTGMSCLVTAGTNWQKVATASHGGDKGTSKSVDREF